jgi:hypothetical protein
MYSISSIYRKVGSHGRTMRYAFYLSLTISLVGPGTYTALQYITTLGSMRRAKMLVYGTETAFPPLPTESEFGSVDLSPERTQHSRLRLNKRAVFRNLSRPWTLSVGEFGIRPKVSCWAYTSPLTTLKVCHNPFQGSRLSQSDETVLSYKCRLTRCARNKVEWELQAT